MSMKIRVLKKTITLNKSDFRDLRIMVVAIVLNLAFAAEKLFIVIWHQQSDFVWLCVYWWLWIALSVMAFIDFIHDEIEEEHHETNIML